MEADVGFHRVIATASGNPVLSALIDALGNRTMRTRLWRAITDSEAERVSVDEHRAVLDALRAGDGERAGIRMAQHLLGVEDFGADGGVATCRTIGNERPVRTPRTLRNLRYVSR